MGRNINNSHLHSLISLQSCTKRFSINHKSIINNYSNNSLFKRNNKHKNIKHILLVLFMIVKKF